MNCKELQAHLRDYMEERLDVTVASALEAHLRGCDDCRALVERCRETCCQELAEFLCDYVEGELPPAKARVLERHLEICAECVAYLDSYRKTVELGCSCREEHTSAEGIPDQLVNAILEALRADVGEDGEGELETESEE